MSKEKMIKAVHIFYVRINKTAARTTELQRRKGIFEMAKLSKEITPQKWAIAADWLASQLRQFKRLSILTGSQYEQMQQGERLLAEYDGGERGGQLYIEMNKINAVK